MASLKKSLSWSFLEQAGSKVVSLVVQIVLARLLDPEAFGVLAILLVVVNIADVIAQSGLGSALIQKRDVGSAAASTSFWLSLMVAVVLYCIVFAIAPLVSAFFQMESLVLYLRAIAIAIIFNSMNSIQRSLLQKELDFKSLFKANITAAALSGVIGISCALLGFGIWSLVVQSIMQSAAMCIALFAVGKWHPTRQFSKEDALGLFSYGWKISATGILNALYTGLSEFVIGKVCDPVSLGLYSQGRKYPMAAISMMTSAIANVLFPAFSSLIGDKDRLIAEIRRVLRLGTFIVTPISLLCAVMAQPLIILLLTEKWIACVPIFQLCCISNSVLLLQLVNLRAYMALGRSGLYLKLQIWKVVLDLVVVCATAFITADIVAVAIATCACEVFSVLVIDLGPAKKVLGYGRLSQLSDVSRSYIATAIAALAAFLASSMVPVPIGSLLVALLVFAGVFLTSAKMMRMSELEEIASLARKLGGAS